MRFRHDDEIPNLVSPSNQWDTGTLECNSRFNLKELWTLGRGSKLALFATKDWKKVANFESCEVCWVNCSPHHSTKHGASWRSSVFSWQTFLRPGSVQPHCSLWPFQCIYAQFQWKKIHSNHLSEISETNCAVIFLISRSAFPQLPNSPIWKKEDPVPSSVTHVHGRQRSFPGSWLYVPPQTCHRLCTQKGVTKRYTQMFFWGDVIEKNWNGRSVAWKDRPNRRSHDSLIGTMLFSLMSSRNLSNKKSAKTRGTPFVSKYQSWNVQNLGSTWNLVSTKFCAWVGFNPPKDDIPLFFCKESQPSNQSFISQRVESKA